MGLEYDYIEGQTPLDEDEKEGLLIPAIATRMELDEFEQQNIEKATQWTIGRKFKPDKVFSRDFLFSLHKRMYGDVWKWAGTVRKTNKNIGVDKWQIETALQQLLEDAQFWYKNDIFPPDEMAIRFKHRLVSIHCFPNGNGRHSRLMADIIVEKLYDKEVFTWGADNLSKASNARILYLQAVRMADKNVYGNLLQFARS